MKNISINFNKREKNLEKKMRNKQKFAKRQQSVHASPKYISVVALTLCVMEETKNAR